MFTKVKRSFVEIQTGEALNSNCRFDVSNTKLTKCALCM